MTHRQLCHLLAARRSLPQKVAREAVTAMVSAIAEAMARGERVELRGFGVFGARDLPARNNVHPKTGRHHALPPRRVPTFRPSALWGQSLASNPDANA